jgi:glutathione synthase/RimK-type ligase-like ATP-grasp enzyme
MADHLVLIEKPSDWKPTFPDMKVAMAREYISSPEYADRRDLRVLNLCRSYRYLSVGYYCSLLAEARRHKVVPSIRTINDLSRKAIYSLDFEDLDSVVARRLGAAQDAAKQETPKTELELDVFFGQCAVPEMADLAQQLFEVFRMPLLKAEFKLQGRWRLAEVRPIHIHTLDAAQEATFLDGLAKYLSSRWREPRERRQYRYDLAILWNPTEEFPPSDALALKKLVKAGNQAGVDVELIEKKDYGRLAEYDALFIRETTGINHHTYQFAKKAEAEGMVVIDDADSILKCTNKVYLAELLRTHHIPTPKTVIVRRDSLEALEDQIPYPIVLKIPDGSFSRGVFKVENRDQLENMGEELLKSSDLILAQEFVYTPYDWRIGILNREALFACQYFMTDRHWQVIKHGTKGQFQEGEWKTMAVEDAPPAVVKTALRAANLIGDGLYGVDVKQDEERIMVMEVNENPNLEATVEDAVLKDRLYEVIIEDFIWRIEQRREALERRGRYE